MIEEFIFAARNLREAKLRSMLTVFGIIIGVAIVVSMVSIGEGMKASIFEQLNALGGDKIMITPQRIFQQRGPPSEFVPFGSAEVKALRALPGVKDVVEIFLRPATAEFRGETQQIYVEGVTVEGLNYFRQFFSIREGRFFSRNSLDEVNIGYRVAYKLFDEDISVGDYIEVRGKKLKVVGILEEIGNSEDDSAIYMSLKGARELYNAGDEVTMMWVIADNPGEVNVLSKKIEDVLKKIRGIKDFDVLTQEKLAEQIKTITAIVTFVLAGIASISMVVGGVIIMNTMLTSVLERTREIGVMKAVGANDGIVLRIFVAEAVLMGVLGGITGLTTGYFISKAIEYAGRLYIGSTFRTVITPELVLYSMLFSVLIGIIAGAYPAYRAAKLNPVEALRYE